MSTRCAVKLFRMHALTLIVAKYENRLISAFLAHIESSSVTSALLVLSQSAAQSEAAMAAMTPFVYSPFAPANPQPTTKEQG